MKRLMVLISIASLLMGCADIDDLLYGERTTIKKWPNATVIYCLADSRLTDYDRALIEMASEFWSENTPVRFERVEDIEECMYKITVSTGWRSSIGYQGYSGYMKYVLHDPGASRHIIHEFGHALGLVHEHQRPDRSDYVNIYWGNIKEDYTDNFEKYNNPLITESHYPYDYNSVMHYTSWAFSNNGQMTIEMADCEINCFLPYNTVPSEIDYEKITDIYND